MPPARFHPFEAGVRETLRRRGLAGERDRVLVALSGGPDSTALLAALCALRGAGVLADVHACHVDHQLRPDSAADGEACAAVCARLGVPLERVAVVVPPGGNVQAAARKVRYAALRDGARRCGATRIATGHTRTDQAETVLHRLLRGAGARGLAAIPPRRGILVRPLIDRSRAEVLDFLRDRQLPWREDPTNATPRFLRNRIRAELVPVVEALSPGAEWRIARAADLLRGDDRALERRAAALARAGAAGVAVDQLLEVPPAVRRRVVRRLWRAVARGGGQLGAGHVEAVLRLLRRGRPGSVALPGGREARVRYGTLEVREAGDRAAAAKAPAGEVVVAAPGIHRLPGLPLDIEVRWNSGDAPPWPVVLRTRRPGDRFHPSGRPGGKKLKSWLIDAKVPRERRDGLLVVADPSGQVLAVPELGAFAEGAAALEVHLRPRRDGRPGHREHC